MMRVATDDCVRRQVRTLRDDGQAGRTRERQGNTQGLVRKSITICRY
jgi:hypothetical protein